MNLNAETAIAGTVAPEAGLSAVIRAEAQVLGAVPSAVMALDDWAISVIPFDGGNRLIARKGTQVQTMDVLNGFMGVADDGSGNIVLS